MFFSAYSQPLYWENPSPFTNSETDCRFPATVSGNSKKAPLSVCFWEEVDKEKSEIYLASSTSKDGLNWSDPSRFAGPFQYSGEIPELYSVAMNRKGLIEVAVLSGINEISVYESTDGVSFTQKTLPPSELPLVGPRIFPTSSDGFILFATRGQGESFSLVSAVSKSSSWSEFTEFPFSYPGASNPLVPYLSSTKSGDMIVFQAHYSSGNHYSFQIFSSVTKDGGKTWSEPAMITSSMPSFENYNNQRPVILSHGDDIYLAWERSPYNGITSAIYTASIKSTGEFKDEPEQISTTKSAIRPILFEYSDGLYMIWTDTQNDKGRIFLTKKMELFWDDASVIVENVSTSLNPVVSNAGNELSFAWERKSSKKGNSQIAMLFRDASASPPVIIPKSFKDGKGGTSDLVTATVEESPDSSGIRGFSFLWTRDINAEPLDEVTNMPQENSFEGTATEDGPWYFKVRQQDYAGNWSRSAVATYIRDTTAPLAPSFKELPLDENGLMQSNTFTVAWQPDPTDTDIAGYTWSLQYIDSIPGRLAVNKRHPLRLSSSQVENIRTSLYEKNKFVLERQIEPPKYIRGNAETLSQSFKNRGNGLYIFTVAAIDEVGNISESTSTNFILNKYIPQTIISAVTSNANVFGDISMEILGGGFTYEGTVSSIFVDQDGQAPYDHTLTAVNGDFTVHSDNRISGIEIKNIAEGKYYVGLNHTDRGMYVTKEPVLQVKEYGTVKRFKATDYVPAWISNFMVAKYKIDLPLTLVILVLIFTGIVIAVATRGLSSTAKEAMTVQEEVRALIEGGIMPEERKAKQEKLHRKGVGLRFKLVAYTMLLILMLITALTVALGYIMIRREEQTRAKGLQERVHVILDSLSSGAKINLPNASANLLALSDLTGESEALSDANYATITGYSSAGGDTNIDYIWATNDPAIASKIDTQNFVLGESRLLFSYIQDIAKKCASLNETAAGEINFIADQITQLTQEGISLATKDDKESVERRQEISEVTTQLSNRMNETLDRISTEGIGSYPEFTTESIDTENTTYLFYKPVMYRHGNEQTYVHGIVFVEISTDALVYEINHARETIVKTAAIVVAVGLLLGFLFSFIISAIIVRPIMKLANHVAMIRDTDDKENLSGKDIVIKSRDEIGMLGDTVNEMTHGLVEAAIQSKNLTFGKEVQTRFIPLQTDEKGNTLTYGSMKTGGADFFSYYAGADDLSGDYFDYKQIDENHYIIIKCDVSGHGVPAALIMVEVAALFLNAFNNWSMTNPKQGTNLSPVVSQINDLIESRGFKGRFAAFTLCLMNTKTGDCWFCNAGDSLVQIYDGSERKKKAIPLPETPAAGMFSTDLVDMKGGYKVVKLKLKKDDVLFLYTDGIEEAKRNFRDAKGQPVVCNEAGMKEGDTHGNHTVGEASEEMTPERVTDIIETVFNRGTYVLEKWHNPNPNEVYTFDFSTCEGTAEEAIMALVSIEKIFRMYKLQDGAKNGRVKVDKKIDEFLRLHFKDYSTYCLNRSEIETDPTHLYYMDVSEDQQYDDLTLVAIKKN